MILLRRSEDIRSLITVLLAFTLMAAQWGGWYRHPLAWCVEVLLVYQCFIINHNHQHLPTFTRNWLNRAFDVVLTMASGLPASLLIPLHNRNHHAANNGPDDYMRTSLSRWRWPLLRLLLYPVMAAIAYAPRKRRVLADIARDEPWLHRRLVAQRLVLVSALAALTIAQPAATVLYVALPWMLGHYWVMNANYLQHEGCDPASDSLHSRDMTGRLLNWFTFNGGFHSIHHDLPALHWSDLRSAYAAQAASIPEHLNERSFAALLWRMATGRYRRRVSQA